jgi:hypothetical protein
MSYDIEICGFDHSTCVVGEDAKQVLINGLKKVDIYQKYICGLYQHSRDVNEVAERIAREVSKFHGLDTSSENFMMPVYIAEVRKILKASGITENHPS